MKTPSHKGEKGANHTGLVTPLSDDDLSFRRHVNVKKANWCVAIGMNGKRVQNVGVPIQIGVDVEAHRIELFFEQSDSV
jgi:hypothetical protein